MTTEARYQALLLQHTHAIIDWTIVVYQGWLRELPAQPLVPRPFRNTDDDIMPALLTLGSLSETYRKKLTNNLEEAQSRPYMLIPACLLHVDPGLSPNSLTHHLIDKLMLDGPGREGAKRLLKYHRSELFLHLLRILPPPRIRQLFGPIQAWSVPFQREWLTFTPPAVTSIPKYWAVNEEQSQRIARIDIINDVLKRWQKKTGHEWESVEAFHADAEKTERLLLSGVSRYRMVLYEDQLLFGLHSLLYGEDFHEHPRIQHILRTVQREGWGYTGGCASVTEEEWEDIAAARPDRVTIEHIHQRKKYHAPGMRELPKMP